MILGSGRSPGVGKGNNPLQYSCLENPLDRGAWPATVHTRGRRESDTAERSMAAAHPHLQQGGLERGLLFSKPSTQSRAPPLPVLFHMHSISTTRKLTGHPGLPRNVPIHCSCPSLLPPPPFALISVLVCMMWSLSCMVSAELFPVLNHCWTF